MFQSEEGMIPIYYPLIKTRPLDRKCRAVDDKIIGRPNCVHDVEQKNVTLLDRAPERNETILPAVCER